MGPEGRDLPELQNLGLHLLRARLDRGLTQGSLARQTGLSQTQVSLFEGGRRLPALDQLVRLARALDVPLQRLLTGTDRPGGTVRDLAVELRGLGATDLWVGDSVVPGAARRAEEVIALAVSGSHPITRIVETLPALLSWNEVHPTILRAYSVVSRTRYRLAWLAEIALTIDRQRGFPGGCDREPLERFLKGIAFPAEATAWDDLGRPGKVPPDSPLWRRWKVSYDATLETFEQRAKELVALRDSPRRLQLPVPRHGAGLDRPRRRSTRSGLGLGPGSAQAAETEPAAKPERQGVKSSRKKRSRMPSHEQ